MKLLGVPFIVGSITREPYLAVDGDGRLSGASAPYILAQYYFLSRKFNLTFLSVSHEESNSCDDNGYCTGSLLDLQSGRIDSVRLITLDQFPTLPVNITLGSLAYEDNCHLINNPDINVAIRSDDFLDFEERFDLPVLVLMISFCLGLILITIVTNRYLRYLSNRVTVWDLFGISFNSDFLPLLNVTSLHGLNFSMFAFFMTSLFMASLQTGLIRSTIYKRVDTLQDILLYNLTPTAFSTLYCRYTIEKSKVESLSKIKAKLEIMEKTDPASVFEVLGDNQKVLIASKKTGFRVKGGMCNFQGSSSKSWTHVSKTSISKLLFFFVVGSSTESKIRKVAIKNANRAFESSNFDNYIVQKIDFNCYSFANYYSPCIQSTISDEKVILNPLKLEYFDSTLIASFSMSLTGFIVFLFEALFPPINIPKRKK